jgi:ABC-type amino acid transport substrate-binding protein
MHYATIALIGAFAARDFVRIRRMHLVRVVFGGILLISIALIGVRAFYTHVVVVPYTMDEYLRGMHRLREPQPFVVHTEAPTPSSETELSGPRSLAQIRESGVLRVGYWAGNYPLMFFNVDGELVGFDSEMAHRFADRLDLTLEFVPLRLQSDDLSSGYCDVVFNSVTIEPSRSDWAVHTNPFDVFTLAVVVPNRHRDDFATWDRIAAQGEISIALSLFQQLQGEVSRRLPQANAVRFSSLEEQRRYFENDGEGAAALLDAAEEGSAWTVLYPQFAVVVPRPVVQMPVAYLVAHDNPSLLRAVNEWLHVEKTAGSIDEIHDYWIQGNTERVKPPRWSVVRDVLGWVD